MAPRAVCINLYGATETQRAFSFLELPRRFDFCDPENDAGPDPGSRGLEKAIPAARPGPGRRQELLVLSGRGALAGVGELGEIFIRSRYLALGYADPAETPRKVPPDPLERPIPTTACTTPATSAASCSMAASSSPAAPRLPGQDPRLPHRAAGDRSRPAPPSADRRRGEDASCARTAASHGKTPISTPAAASRPDQERASCCWLACPITWCRPLSCRSPPSTQPHRQNRPPGPAGAAPRSGGRRIPAAGHPEEEMLAALFGQLLGRQERNPATTISSSWAAIPCSPPSCWPAPATSSAPLCRYARFSRSRPSKRWPPPSTRRWPPA